MNTWRKLVFSKKSISWLALIAIAMLSLFPAHIHLQHDNDAFSSSHTEMTSQSHEHGTIVHVVADTTSHTGHTGHDNETIVPATSDSLIKKVNLNPIFLAILIGFFVFLRINFLPHKFHTFIFKSLRKIYFDISPPLRAPPVY
ncbi:MAG: hypothetical protein KAT25_11355 [Sulfuriflexus sp.]|nr:hypothetical protein [Sulfuriflexus sp.]